MIRQMLSKSLLAASVVIGTILVFLQHGDRLIAGAWAWDLSWKILGTYVLSYLMVACLGLLKDQE